MKIFCPRCNGENDSALAQAGKIECVGCGKWFTESGWNPPATARVPERKASPAAIVWPTMLVASFAFWQFGFIPFIVAIFLIVLCIVGSAFAVLKK